MDVASVTDGDTIDVFHVNGQAAQPVRLVGVDARESGGPYQEDECFGAGGRTVFDVAGRPGRPLFIEQDQEERDRFGRLLRWVWLERADGKVFLLDEDYDPRPAIRSDSVTRRTGAMSTSSSSLRTSHSATDTDFGAPALAALPGPACLPPDRPIRRIRTATSPTRTSAFRRPHPISGAATFPTRGSACSHPIRTTSTEISTVSPARVRDRGSWEPCRGLSQ